MNTSQFMDKQIMDLSSQNSSKDFIDLMNPPQDEDDHDHNANGISKEEILPSYDFQPINRPTASATATANLGGSSSTRPWSSSDSKTNTDFQFRLEPTTFKLGKEVNFPEAAISEIDRTMKKHADNLLHALEGVSARLTQLESRTRNLENSVDDLKVSVGNNYGSTDGKMRQLENIMREVQTGVQVLKDKQEILEAQLQLTKLQVSKAEQQSETQSSVHIDTVPQPASAPLQSHQQPPAPATFQQQPPVNPPPSLPYAPPPSLPNAPPPPPPQANAPPPVQLPNQYPQSQALSLPQREPYFPPPGQTQEAMNPQNPVGPVPPVLQSQNPAVAAPPQPYPPALQPQYSQPPQPPQQHPSLPPVNAPQPQPSLGHHPEETPYVPSPTYPPGLRQPSSQPPSGPPTSQQYYGVPSSMYEPPPSRSSSGFPTGYGSQSGPVEPYPYGGSPSQYGPSSAMKPQQFSSPAVSQSGGSGYPQLPTARVLPQALPTASSVGSGSVSPRTGNRVPLDDVVDKVTNMGFPREHVRATVRKLTENGQSVDLNVVLDKLMNDGEIQPPRGGWFGR